MRKRLINWRGYQLYGLRAALGDYLYVLGKRLSFLLVPPWLVQGDPLSTVGAELDAALEVGFAMFPAGRKILDDWP